ncbi:MAG TPA: ACP S-malonyltransferase [Kofleriaceae bacterium]|nr:ACP S-malonyltransferase [Kofleriaceae bacterium]
MTTALVFPGQGSQRVAMGKELAARFPLARRTYEEADDALGFSISQICFEGPEDTLVLTQNAQPAILTTSIAVLRVLQAEKGLTFAIAAGHSLGEWSALVAVGAFSLADAVKLTNIRGKLMQEAVPVGAGAMAAVIGLDLDKVKALCAESAAPGEPCEPANLNGGGQVVISGATAAIDRAVAAAKGKGAKLVKKLDVSAPFHCSMMKPAADGLRLAMDGVEIQPMRAPVVSNVEATANQDHKRVKDLLWKQVTAPVRWEESVLALKAAGVTQVFELGSGAVLKGLVKRIADLPCTTIGEPHEVEAFGGAA